MDRFKQIWIEVGYDIFSKEGYKGLKVEDLARKTKKSKSSFYHHFADMEIFLEFLLNHHLEQAKIIAYREKQCKSMIPDVLNLLLDVKKDLFFNRQLRINRNIPAFKQCFEKINEQVEETFLEIWAEAMGLTGKTKAGKLVLLQTIDQFYLQINEENFTYEWLLKYTNDLYLMVAEIKKM